MSSSPAVFGQTVVVQVENQGDSFAAGFDTATGATRWRIERDAMPSWASPIAMRGGDGQDVLLLQSPSRLTAHDPHTGRQLWAYNQPCEGIPSAAAVGGVVFAPSSGITALRPGVESEPTVLWQAGDVQPGAASPLVHDGCLYAVNRGGVLTSAAADSGQVLWKLRLDAGAYWSTPVLAGNRLYCFADNGQSVVVQVSSDRRKGEIVGRGVLGESVQSSPAVAGGALYVRSDRHLWKIGAR
jgi:outer membrane protein assembly factor BamB